MCGETVKVKVEVESINQRVASLSLTPWPMTKLSLRSDLRFEACEFLTIWTDVRTWLAGLARLAASGHLHRAVH